MANKKIITAQSLFNKSYTTIVKQGRPSYKLGMDNITPKCMYRQRARGQTLKCAAGALITDKEAAELAEGARWDDLDDDSIPERLQPHASLISAMQTCHDEACFNTRESPRTFLKTFKEYMTNLADQLDLTLPKVPKRK